MLAGWFPRGNQSNNATWSRRHRSILWLLAAHVLGLAAFGLVRGFALGLVALDLAPIVAALLLARYLPSRTFRSMSATLGLMMCSAVMVHLSGGSIEAHFHFFVMVGVVAGYHSWLPFALAVGFVLVHHTTVGVLVPEAVYNDGAAIRRPWLWALIHAGFILASAIVSLQLWKQIEAEQAEAARRAAAEREHLVRLQGAATINDTIVQDLVAARYALEFNDQEFAREALDVSLTRAQQLVSSLIEGDDEFLRPGGLRRLAIPTESP